MNTPTNPPTPVIKGSPLLKGFRAHLKTPVTALLLACFSLWTVQSSQADTFSWNVDAAGNSSLGGNWLGGISPNTISVAGDILNLNNVLTAPRTVTLDGLVRAGTLNIGDTQATPFAFTLAAGTGGYLTLDDTDATTEIIKSGNALDTISTGLQFNDTLAITNSSGTGTLTLSGAMRSLTSDITFNGTGAVATGSIVASGVISTAGNLVKNDAGITTLSGANIYAGSTTINGGTLILTNAASLPVRSAVTVGASGTLSLQNAMTFGSLTGAGTVTNTTGTARILTIGRDDTSTSFSGQLTATTPANLAITKIGAGTLTLAPAAVSTYTGNTVINGGTINLSFANTSLTSLWAATPLQITGGNFTMTGKAGLAANQLLGALTVGATGGAITLVTGDASGTTLRTGAVTATASGGALLITAPANTVFQMGNSYAATTLNNRIVFSNGTANTFNWAVNTGANTTTTAFGAYTALPIAGGGLNTTAYNLTASQTQTTAAFVGRSVKLGSTLGSAQTWDLATFNATLGGTATASPGAILIDGTDAWNINGSTGVLGQATVAGGDLIFQQYNTTNAVTVNAGIANGAGTLNLVKAGPGTLVLAGTNTFTGTVFVDGGTLSFNNVAAAGAGSLGNGSTTAVTIRDGATLQYTGATGSISGAATTAGAHTFAFQGGNANIEVTQTTTLLTLAGVVSGAGGFTKLGTGTLQLNGATNTFSGPVFINNGVLQGGGSNFIADTTPVTFGATGSLDINGTATSQTETIGSISGSGVIFNSNTNTKTLAVGGDNTSTTFSGTFAANGSVAGGLATGVAGNVLTKQGSGVLTLTNAVTSAWTGGNNVNGGVLRLGASNTLSSTGTMNIGLAAGPAALELGAGFTQTLAALTIHGTGATTTSQGNVIIGTGATLTVVGNITYNGAQNALGAVISGPGNYSIGGADRTITVNDSTTVSSSAAELTISTPIASVGAFGITKAGAGNLLLSGNNTYTGTTIIGGAGGTTTFSGSNTSMTGATTLNSATLILDYSSNPTTRKMGSGLFSALGGTLVLNGNTSTPSLETITGNTTFAAGGRVAITLNRAGQDLALNLGTLTRAAGAGTVRFNLPTGTQSGTNGILTSTSADATTGLLGTGGAWATVTDATGTNFATKSGNNIVAVTPTAVPTITSWVTGQNVTDSTVYTGTLDAETAINSLRFNASAGASTVALTPGGLLRIASGGILQTDQVTGGVSTISGGRLESSSGSELVFTTDSATQRLDVSSTITGASLITKTGNGTLRFSGNNNATGAVSLQAGTLELTGGNALGDTAAVTLTALGGGTPTLSLLANQTETIGSLSGGQTTNTSAAVSLGASSTLTINQGADTSYTGRLVGDGTLVKSGAFALQLDNTSAAFTGALRVDQGQVTLSGNLGNLTGLNSVVVNGAGTLRLNYADNNNGDRIRDLATVTVNNTIFAAGGGLRINNTSGVGRSETVAALTLGAGHNSLWVDGTNGGNFTTTMTFASLAANNRATSLVVGRSLGTLTAANESRIIFTAAPTAIGGGGLAGTTNISIVPNLIGEATAAAPTSANVGNSFVSLGDGTNGVRPLNLTTEYVLDQAAPATGTNNLRYTASNTITTPAAINALALDSGSAIALTGSASSMDIGSGAILAAGAGAHSIGTITGLTTTAATYYTYVTNAAGSLTLTTPLTTAVPLAKSGAGTLILNTASHAFTDLFFNHGVVQADALNKLGSGAFNFHGGTLKFGAAFDPSTKTMTFGTGGAVFDTTGFDIIFANAVGNSGTGGLTKIGTNNLTLSAANTFTGATTVSTGRLILDGGAGRLSTTAGLTLTGTSSLQLGGASVADQTVTELVGVAGNSLVGGNASVSTLTVNQNTSTSYLGLIGGAGTNENNIALVKSGTGALTLGGVANTFTGGLTIKAGGVVAGNNSNTLGANSNAITLGDTSGSADASLTFFNTASGYANPITVAAGSSGSATIFLGTTTGSPALSGGITLNKDLILSKLGTTGNGQVTGGIGGTGNLIISNNATTGTITLATAAVNPTGSITNSGLASGTTTISADIGSSVTSITQKSATSNLTLSGASIAYTGATTVGAGTLNITGDAAGGTRSRTTLTVDGGATLNTLNTAGQIVNLSGAINLGAGTGTTTLGLDIGSLSNFDQFNSAVGATTANAVVLNFTGLGGIVAGNYDLLTATGGLNTATYSIGTFTNPTGGLTYSLSTDPTFVRLTTAALAAGAVYWGGAVNTSWAGFSGSLDSNFATTIGGTNAKATPGINSNVIFSTNTQTVATLATSLNAAFSIRDLTFNNEVGSGLLTSISIAPGTGGTLTLTPTVSTAGINVETGAPASIAISAPVTLGAAQTWTVTDTATNLASSGGIGGTANLIKGGAGILTLSGTNNYVGTTTVTGGVLGAGATNGFNQTSAHTIGASGTLRLNNSAATIGSLAGSGTVELGTAATATRVLTVGGDNTSTTFSGILQNNNPGFGLGLTKVGTGEMILSGSLSTNSGAMNINGGRLRITGTYSQGANLGSTGVGNVATSQGALYVPAGASYSSATIGIGGNASGIGSLVVTGGGTVTATTSNTQAGISFGNGGYGGVFLSGATSSITTPRFETNASVAATAIGITQITGGTLTTTGDFILLRNGRFDFTMTGGLVDRIAPGNTIAIGSEGAAAYGGALTIAGGAIENTGTSVQFKRTGTMSGTASLNLNGGTLTTNAITVGGGTASSVANINFNGGTLKASAAGTFIPTTIDNLRIYSGGAIIDSNGNNITIAEPILAPTGDGITGVTGLVAGSGYIGAPFVEFSGGGGTGATGYALVDLDTTSGTYGQVTSVVISNPGVGYTSAPTITLVGGGGTGATVTANAPVANASGGLTKEGGGILTLSGLNTYTGGTTINAGTVALGVTNALADTGNVTIAGGTFNVATFSDTVANLVLSSGSLTGSTGVLTSTAGYDLRSGTVNFTGAGNLGVGAITKTTGGTVTLAGNGVGTAYAGAVAINAGTVAFTAGTQFGAASGISVGTASTIGTLSYTNNVTSAMTQALTVVGATGGGGGGVVNVVAGGNLQLNGGVTSTALADLEKTGNGTATIGTITNTLNGGTLTVTGGTVVGDFADAGLGGISVANGATYNLFNQVNSTFRNNAISTLSLASGSAIGFDLGAPGSNDLLTLTGTPAVAGTISVNLNNLGGLAVGTYDLINVSAGSLNGASWILGPTAPSGFNYSFDPTANSNQTLRLTASTLNLVYWQGDQDGKWNTNNGANLFNWASDAGGTTDLNALPDTSGPSRDTLVFSTTNNTGGSISTTLDQAFEVDSLRFINATTPVTTDVTIASGTGTNVLTLTPQTSSNGISIADNAGDVTISAGVATGAIQTWEVVNTGSNNSSLTLSGGVAFDHLVTKTATGTLTISAAGTGGGGLRVNGGTFEIGNDTAFGTGTLVLDPGVTINATGGNRSLTSNNVQTWNGSFTFTGSNTLNLGNGAVTMGNNVTTTVSASTLTVGGIIGDGGNSYALNKAGTGTLVLNGANTYDGLTNLQVGTLTLNGDNNAAGGGVTMAASTTLNIGHNNAGTTNALGTGTFTINGGTLDNTSGSAITANGGNNAQAWNGNFTFTGTNSLNLGTGAVTLGATTQITTSGAASTLTVGGIIDDGASTFGLTKLGAGTLSLGGLNTYQGATVLNQGALIYTADQNLTDITNTLTLGSTSGSTAAYSMDLSAASAHFGGAMVVQTSNATANTITIGAAETLRADGAVTIGFNGAAHSTTKLNMTGASGAFRIGDVGAPTNLNFQLGNSSTSGITNAATLDMSGLGTFYANLGGGTFRVGDPTNSGGSGVGGAGSTLILAANSTIIATAITSDSPTSDVNQAIKLGSGTNEFNSGTITIGGAASRATGSLDFNAATGTLKIRALDGVGRAAMNVQNGSASTGASLFGTVDFISGDAGVHTVDLLLGILAVGGRSAGTTASGTGVFAFDTGTLDATTLNIAARTGTTLTTGNVSGTVTIGGTSSTIGTVTMATNSVALTAGSSTGDATSILNITGGTNSITTLTMGVNTVAAGFATGSNTDATINITGGATTVNTTFTMGAQNSALNAATNVNTAISTLNISAGSLTLAGSTNLTMGQATLDADNAATSTIAITGTGTLTVGGNIQYTNAALGTETNTVTLNGGTLDMTAGNIGGAGGAGTVTFNAQSGTLQNLAQLNGGGASPGATLTKTTGGTLIMQGTNAYTGGTAINGGILQANSSGGNSLGTTGNISFGGGTLQYTANDTTDYSARIVNSASAVSIDTNGQTVTFATAVAASNTSGLTKLGTGTLTFTAVAASAYTGNTAIQAGTLQLGNGGADGRLNTASTISVDATGTFKINQSDTVVQGTDFSGAAITGAGKFEQAGGGITTLNQANLYQGGTDVTGGTLLVSNTTGSGTGTGAVIVTGATLGGNGTLAGATTLNAGGILAAGAAASTAGTLTLESSLTLAGSGSPQTRLLFDYTNATGNVGSTPAGWWTTYSGALLTGNNSQANDLMNLTATTASTLNWNTGGKVTLNQMGSAYTWILGDVLNLMDWTSLYNSGGPINGTFDSTADFDLPSLSSGLAWDTTRFVTTGAIAVVPEPSRLMLLFFGLLGLCFRRRRNN